MSVVLLLARRARRTDWFLLAPLAFTALLMWPLLKTGFLCDDLMNSLIRGHLICHHQTLFQALSADTRRWLEAGRFFPLIFVLSHGTFYLLADLLVYKIYALALLLSNLAVFTWLLRRIVNCPGFSAFCVSLVAVSFQFRAFHDPILGFNGLMQWLLLGTMVSLAALHQHLRSGGRLWMLLSLFTYLLTLLTYEITYAFIALHALLIFAKGGGWRQTARKLWPFALMLGACVTVSMTVRLLAVSPPPVKYQPNLDPVSYLLTLGRQLFAALPLSYLLVDPQQVFATGEFRQQGRLLLTVLAGSFVLAVAILSRLAGSRALRDGLNYRVLVPLGLLLWILPAVLIAMSTGYQKEITLGLGYLPVYIQYYGTGLLGACGCALFLRRFETARRTRSVAVAVLALGFAGVSSITYCANRQVTTFCARPHRDERLNIEAALKAGLADEVPEHALVILDHEYQWWHAPEGSASFYAMHAGKVLDTVPRSRLASPPPGPAYEIKDCCLDEHCGGVLLSTVTPLPTGSRDVMRRLTTSQVRLYVHDDSGTKAQATRFFLTGVYDGADDISTRFFTSVSELSLTGCGAGWGMYSFQTPGRPVVTESLEIIRPRERAEILWGSGFRPAIQARGHSVRGCGNDGVMFLSNCTANPMTFRLSLNLFGVEDMTVTLKGDLFEEAAKVGKGGTAFSRVVRIDPGLHAVRLTVRGRAEAAAANAGNFAFSIIDPLLREVTTPSSELR